MNNDQHKQTLLNALREQTRCIFEPNIIGITDELRMALFFNLCSKLLTIKSIRL